MAECAWQCGDPGVQYDTTINRWHTCPNSGRINASNPCSEYMFLDDTACNLASVNLMKFRKPDGVFDVERFAAACRIFFVAQEILVDHASYPTERIARNSHLFRPLGLGYSNLGSLLMAEGLAYDSAAGRGLCGALTALLHGAANRTSAELAAAVGPFEGFAANREPMLQVMQMHRDAVEQIDAACPRYLHDAARRMWDEVLAGGRQHGYRNAQATVLAPTGTISFLMDCDTTGIEPDIALVKYKQLAGGGMLKIVNQTVPLALRTLGYQEPAIEAILAFIDKNDTIEGAPGLRAEHLPVFDCAFKPRLGERSIAWEAHVKMMAAAQRDAQVQRRRPRGLHHGGPLRRRPAGRTLHHDGEGGQHDRRPDGRVRHVGVDEPAVRRAARGVRQEVLAHALRAVGLYEKSRHPRGQEPRRLPLPLDGNAVPARLPGGESPGRLRGGWRRASGRGGHGNGAEARRHDGARAGRWPRSGRCQRQHGLRGQGDHDGHERDGGERRER
jgi:hypothetical protein